MRFVLAVLFTALLFTGLLAILGATEISNSGRASTSRFEPARKERPTPVITESTERYRAYKLGEREFQNFIYSPGIYDLIVKEIRRRQGRPDRQFVASTTRVTFVAINDQRFLLFNYPQETKPKGMMQQKFWLKDPTGKKQPDLHLTPAQFDALEQLLEIRGNTRD